MASIVPKQRSSDRLTQPPRRRRDPELEQAIASDAIAIHFQPQIDPASGHVIGVEALARWGAESPERLFQRAAAAGLTERLSRHVQRKALRTAGAWKGRLKRLRLSMNLLPQDLARAGFDKWLLTEIAIAGVSPERLTIEITESSLVADRPHAATCLACLRERGIQVAVDDFGTGYASLAYLTSLPLDVLKIDRALIADLVGGSRDRIVVRAMIRLARELGLKVIVEGVETAAQLALLTEWGCDLYQGFLGAGALEEAELARFVAAANAVAA